MKRSRPAAAALVAFPSLILLHSSVCFAAGAPPDLAGKLPPATTNAVDFARDVWPIFDRSCLRCHGPEKADGHFRIDSREAALRGGENGVAIVVGDSAGSPLIHHVARLIEDSEMPPNGKGDPLTPEEIGQLRGWIDQGAKWGAVPLATQTRWSITPSLRYITVSGNRQKFRELNWTKGGWSGGVEEIELRRHTPETEVNVKAHLLGDEHDYGLSIDAKRYDLGFIRGGVEGFRTYFADSGGYFPQFSSPIFSLGRDLHQDAGRAWIDLGLTIEDWPQIKVGYEYQWRRGTRAMTAWGPVTEGVETDSTPRTRYIFPTTKDVNEKVHIMKVDLAHTWKGWRVEDNFRGEFADTKTGQMTVTSYDLANPAAATTLLVREANRSFTGANTFIIERPFTDWLYASGGYLFSRMNNDAAFLLDGVRNPGATEAWRSSQIVLSRQAHVGNLNTQIGPWSGFSLALGAQAEWIRQEGMGGASFDVVTPGPVLQPVTFNGDLDTTRVQETAQLRFTRIPFTTLFAEARLEQETIRQYEDQLDVNSATYVLQRDTGASTRSRDFRGGFSTSPCASLTLSGHYRRIERDNTYNHKTDVDFGGPGFGYSAFIRARDTRTDEVEARAGWRIAPWLRATLSYKLSTTDYHTTTDSFPGAETLIPGGQVLAGRYDTHTYGANVLSTAFRNLTLSGSFTYQDTRLRTAANGNPGVVPYDGDLFSVVATAQYTINSKTDVFATYAFSWSDFSQDNFTDGLPMGIQYQQHTMQAGFTRRLGTNLRARLAYGLSLYREPTAGGSNDFTAHMILASLNWRLP